MSALRRDNSERYGFDVAHMMRAFMHRLPDLPPGAPLLTWQAHGDAIPVAFWKPRCFLHEAIDVVRQFVQHGRHAAAVVVKPSDTKVVQHRLQDWSVLSTGAIQPDRVHGIHVPKVTGVL